MADYNELGVYNDEDMFVRLKANIVNLITEDDDSISANILEDMFRTINSIEIRLRDACDERDSYRRRAIKAEFEVKKAAIKNAAETTD